MASCCFGRALWVASAWWVIGPLAWAQADETAGETAASVPAEEALFRQFQGVEVTGTAILNPRAKEAAPVQVIERREIEQSGARNVAELLQALPVMVNGGELGTSIVRTGPETASIHGHAAGTLVLLNGRRLATYALQAHIPATDMMVPGLSVVPLNAIERVEIMSDGASARYGSDAVAGVVNIITREHLQGPELSVQAGLPDGGGDGTLGLSWGAGDLARDGYSLRIFGQAYQRNRLTAGDRQQDLFASVAPIGETSRGSLIYPNDFKSYSLFGTRPQRTDLRRTPAACAAPYVFVEAYDNCLQFLGDYQDIYPRVQEQHLLVSAERQLAPDTVLFGDWLLANRLQSYSGPLAGGEVTASDTRKGYLFFPSPIAPSTWDAKTQAQRATVGVRGQHQAVDYKFTLNRSTDHGEMLRHGGARPGWNTSLRLTQAQLERPVETWDAEAQAALAALRRDDALVRTGGTRLWQAEALVSGPWKPPMGIEHRWALGGSWMRETLSATPVATAATEASFAQSRRLSAVFAEWEALWTERWRTGVALRHDHYSDVGMTTTGRAQAQWHWSSASFLRMSYGTGFRAPTLRQLNPTRQTTLSLFSSNEVTNQCVRQGSLPTCLEYVTQGNPDLKPERSQHLSAGVRWEPSLRWSLGMDVWRLRIRDIFGTLSPDTIRADPELTRLYVTPGAAGVPLTFNLLALNLGTLDRSGIDYDLQYRLSSDTGRWRLAWQGTHYLRSRRSFVPRAQPVNEIGTTVDQTEQVLPRNRWRLTLTHEQRQWTHRAWLDAVSGNQETVNGSTNPLNNFRDTFVGTVKRQVPAHWTLGMGLVYRPQPRVSWTLAIDNLLNRYPPARYSGPMAESIDGVDTRYGSYLGRTWRVGLSMGF